MRNDADPLRRVGAATSRRMSTAAGAATHRRMSTEAGVASTGIESDAERLTGSGGGGTAGVRAGGNGHATRMTAGVRAGGSGHAIGMTVAVRASGSGRGTEVTAPLSIAETPVESHRALLMAAPCLKLAPLDPYLPPPVSLQQSNCSCIGYVHSTTSNRSRP